ncbi:MAG: chromate transporter [Afipia sp.]|nr:chromate transporter [Afipia sp.]
MSKPSTLPPPASAIPTHAELFLAFFKITLSGFGGTLPWTRRMFVEENRWMTAQEFNDIYALCQFLPGPNIVNLSMVFGSRFRGLAGGVAAFLGLLGPPIVLVTILAAIYAHYGNVPALQRTLLGVSCAAIGLFLAVIFRMMVPLLRRRDPVEIALLLAVFVAIGLLRLPLTWVLLIAIPLSIAIVYTMRQRGAA